MKKKESKENAKKQRELEIQREQEEKERIEMQAKEKEQMLRKRSSPLIDYGLIDAYEYFMVQLTQVGVPQPNLYQFAAQMVLKFAKNHQKQQQELKELNEYNEKAIKESPIRSSRRVVTKNKKSFQPQILPFKGAVTEEEKNILSKEKEGSAQDEYHEEFQN